MEKNQLLDICIIFDLYIIYIVLVPKYHSQVSVISTVERNVIFGSPISIAFSFHRSVGASTI